ncbi:MAG: lipoxygenase family protein [Crocosphaera sp.]|nr:lipoxygenase family protein [Crocosphaera sp.]MDJ0728467.1 lipoxygenase family protein [Crocosphaera sp.]
MNPSLPQNDPNPQQRLDSLEKERKIYQWGYYPNQDGIPMIGKLPLPQELPKEPQWFLDVIKVIIIIISNRAIEDFASGGLGLNLLVYGVMTWIVRFIDWLSQFLEKRRKNRLFWWFINSLVKLIGKILQRRQVSNYQSSIEDRTVVTKPIIPKDLESYNNLFEIIHLPCISYHFQQDRLFAAQRVAGPNPLVLERVRPELPAKFPLSDEAYQSVMGSDDSLQQAIAEKRLYMADYEILDTIKAGHFPPAYRKYIYAPIALFAISSRTHATGSLVPVAIQCGQTPGDNYPIFTRPPTGTPRDQQWSWLMAKAIVQIADGNYHELISHLGRTHLWIEPFVIATQRQLASNHPLGILLRPHFEGTLLINTAARLSLIEEEGTVDAVLGGSIQESIRIAATGVKGYPFTFNDSMLPKFLTLRGVDDFNSLSDYPYRDDGLLIWDSIHQWVDNYLSVYYHSDDDVQKDEELQGWIKALISSDGGRMTGIGEKTASGGFDIKTKAYLIDAVTLIIFTCSAQHAAVNFPQATDMSYVPNMPLAGYTAAPTTPQATKEDYFNLLPPIPQAESQMNTTYALGSVYYTRLGDYGEGYFKDQRVEQPLKAFQNRLLDIETIINDRNEVRGTFYNVLSPSRIPQSINI